jgi:lipoprotein-anchoring transpeptidase ErfK/SrfK
MDVTRTKKLGIIVVLATLPFLFACEAPPPPVAVGRIDVSIQLQRAFVYDPDGGLIREIPISSGARGKTPLGHFRVYSRSSWTTSSTDSRVSMKWMTRFHGGIGFHGIPRRGNTALATPLGVKPVSAGCIRMADEDAKWIFDHVPNGTPVNVIPK